jgi:hypothetical protein
MLIMPYAKTNKAKVMDLLPAMTGMDYFQPSGTMIRVLTVFLQTMGTQEVMTPVKILRSMEKSVSNWYKWQRSLKFIQWWNESCEEYHKRLGLHNVHNAIYCAALGNSPQDRKLYLERFDTAYKPATREEHTFPGIEPPQDTQAAVERAKARAAKCIESTAHDAEEQAQLAPQEPNDEETGAKEGENQAQGESLQGVSQGFPPPLTEEKTASEPEKGGIDTPRGGFSEGESVNISPLPTPTKIRVPDKEPPQ